MNKAVYCLIKATAAKLGADIYLKEHLPLSPVISIYVELEEEE